MPLLRFMFVKLLVVVPLVYFLLLMMIICRESLPGFLVQQIPPKKPGSHILDDYHIIRKNVSVDCPGYLGKRDVSKACLI